MTIATELCGSAFAPSPMTACPRPRWNGRRWAFSTPWASPPRRIARALRRDRAARGGLRRPALVFGSTEAPAGHQCGAGERNRLPRARLRRLQQHAGRPSLGADPAGPVRARRHDAGHGRDFIAAYVAGFETETRIARAVNFHHYDKGWHPTATLGVFGAAAAAARLSGLSAAQTATALAIAASFASGLKANFGTMTKPLHVGQCAQNGVMAALLAREGMTASHDAFEHRQGFFDVFNGVGNYDAGAVLRDWAEPLDIVTPGIAIKRYPCCGSTHPAIDAMLDHRARPRPDAGKRRAHRVVVRIRGVSPTPTARRYAARSMRSFSVEYCPRPRAGRRPPRWCCRNSRTARISTRGWRR